MKIRLLTGLLIGLVASCGGSTPTANLGGFSSSIAGNTQLDQLTPAQLQTLCGEVDAFDTSSGQVMDLENVLCLTAGIFSAALVSPQTDATVQAACTSAYNQCLATPGTETFSCPTMAALAGCTVTVAEYSACINDSAKVEIMSLGSLPSCQDLTVADLQSQTTTGPATQLPASCQTIQQQCPNAAM